MSNEPNRKKAEDAAQAIWKRFRFASPSDLKLDVLAFALGVVVTEGRLDTADARLVRNGQRGLVRVNRDIPEPGRKRFAIAHEVGHFEIHENDSQHASCSSEDMVADYRGSKLEVEANYFAAELLMPKDQFVKRMGDPLPSFEAVRELKEHFLTSMSATALRFVDLSTDDCALVVSSEGRIRWWRANEGFRNRYFIRSGDELSANSIAGSLHRGERREGKPVRIDASAWGGPAGETGWWEDALVMSNYGQTLSLIRAG